MLASSASEAPIAKEMIMPNPTKKWLFAALVGSVVTVASAEETGKTAGAGLSPSTAGPTQRGMNGRAPNMANTAPPAAVSDTNAPAIPATSPQKMQEGRTNSPGPVSGLKKPY